MSRQKSPQQLVVSNRAGELQCRTAPEKFLSQATLRLHRAEPSVWKKRQHVPVQTVFNKFGYESYENYQYQNPLLPRAEHVWGSIFRVSEQRRHNRFEFELGKLNLESIYFNRRLKG